MAEFEIKCPHCGESLEVQDEWVGMETTCPVCGKDFVIPRRPAAVKRPPVFKLPKSARKTAAQNGSGAPEAPAAAPAESANGSAEIPMSDKDLRELEEMEKEEKKKKTLRIVKWSVRIVLLIAILVGGYLIYQKLTVKTPKSLEGNQLHLKTGWRKPADNESGIGGVIEHDLFPEIKSKADFFYRDANFKSVSVGRVEKKNKNDNFELERYEGTVTFVRKVGGKDKEMERPIELIVEGQMIHCNFPVDYAKNPEYLEDDGDLILALAAQIDRRLKGCEYVSGKAENGVLDCVVSKAGVEKKAKLKAQRVENDDHIDRIWVEILSVE